MSISIQTNTSVGTSSNATPNGGSEIAKISRQIQVLTAKLGKIPSEEGMTAEQKKEKAALIQQQIQSLKAEVEQLLKKQAEKAEKKDTPNPSDNKDDKNTTNTIDIHV